MNIVVCKNLKFLSLLTYIRNLFEFLKWNGIGILIILLIIFIIRKITIKENNEIKYQKKKNHLWLIYISIILILPNIVSDLIDNKLPTNEGLACYQAANTTISKNIYNQLADDAVNTAEIESTYLAIENAQIYVDKMNDVIVKNAYNRKLNNLRESIKNKNEQINEQEQQEIIAQQSISNQIVEYAKTALGIPYVWGGESFSYGFDCSGFTKAIFRHFGIYIPHGARSQSYLGTAIYTLAEAKPGDLLFFDWESDGIIDHVAIYIGNNEKIHAIGTQSCSNSYYRSTHSCNVRIDSDNMNMNQIVAIRRIY